MVFLLAACGGEWEQEESGAPRPRQGGFAPCTPK
jgi:hypothetical protein